MDFRLTDQQLELQDAIRTFCEQRYSFERLAAMGESPLDVASWQELCGLDVFRLAVPESGGGLGLGIVETAVVYEVLGHHLVPGPLVWSALAARHVPHTGARARVVGGVEVTGDEPEAVLVEYGESIDALIVLRDGAVFAVEREEIADVVPVAATDPLTPMALVGALPAGRPVGDHAVAGEMRRVGTVLTSALLLGLADRALQEAIGYTGNREQFGRPVGSFQAIKHLLADMYVRTCLARSACYAAAAVADDRGAGELDAAAATAKLIAADAAIRNAKTCIQVHGAMGFTWEMIPHYLLKRSWVLEHTFGTRSEHAGSIAGALADEVAS
jgi:alkylation response protein AidB-like acyl-CoA dehydrogenase